MNSKYTEHINRVIVERKILAPYASILIAISGGQDSIFLCHLFYHLKVFWNWQLGLIHCDHQWHSKSLDHARSLYCLASKINLSSYTAIPPRKLKKNENQARKWRYLIMRRIADTHCYTNVALGHNGSDRVETLIAHAFRGAGLQGLDSLTWKRSTLIRLDFHLRIPTGMLRTFYYEKRCCWNSRFIYTRSPVTTTLVRPLLNLTRAEIRCETQKRGLPLCIDPSNYQLRFQRNRIRHQLLPYLRTYFNPNIDLILQKLADIVEFEVIYIDAVIESLYQSSSKNYGQESQLCTQFSLPCLRVLPIGLQRRMLKKILSIYGISSLNFNQIENIRLDLNRPEYLSDRQIILPKGVILQITKSTLIIKYNLDIF